MTDDLCESIDKTWRSLLKKFGDKSEDGEPIVPIDQQIKGEFHGNKRKPGTGNPWGRRGKPADAEAGSDTATSIVAEGFRDEAAPDQPALNGSDPAGIAATGAAEAEPRPAAEQDA